jgi:hypothetical protein
MKFPASDLLQMLTHDHDHLKFIITPPNYSWRAIFAFEGKYYGCPHMISVNTEGQVECLELHRAMRPLIEFVTLDDLYNTELNYTPLDPPFVNWRKIALTNRS